MLDGQENKRLPAPAIWRSRFEFPKKLNIKNGKSESLPLSLTAPAGGTSDFLIFVVDPGNTLKETTPANDTIVSPSKVTFS
jgi:hypothetical protein